MYIISNNCVGSFIYKIKKVPFNIPTTWARSSYKTIKEIYNKLKNNEEIKLDSVELIKSTYNNDIYVLAKFNEFDIHYSHYLYKNEPLHSFETEDTRGDIVGNTILDYAKTHIENRLKRDKGKDKPIFILDCSHQNPNVLNITAEDIDDYMNWNDNNIIQVLVTKSIRRYNRYKNNNKNVIVIFAKKGSPRYIANLVMQELNL